MNYFDISQHLDFFLLFLVFISIFFFFYSYSKNKLLSHQKHIDNKNKEENQKFEQLVFLISEKFMIFQKEFNKEQYTFKEIIQKESQMHQKHFAEHLFETFKTLQESLQVTLREMNQNLIETFKQASNQMGEKIEGLTRETGERLKDISQQVERRLTEGFEKTNTTFTDIIQRLLIIDQAQKNLSELSNNIVGLQDILNDRSARGSFGEVQLSALINDMLPPNCVSFQHQFNNGKRADCVLFLPAPTGNIAIDAKFPLENYRKSIKLDNDDLNRRHSEQQFKQDIKKHIQDVASKYILPGETADGAILFIPAESVFAHIHAHYPEIIEFAHRSHVWLVSPNTLMAILTTARAVLKDQATREQVHIIRNHLNMLAKDFGRFQKRMNHLEKHIDQAQEDVKEVSISARKINSRFQSIEKAELSIESIAVIEEKEE